MDKILFQVGEQNPKAAKEQATWPRSPYPDRQPIAFSLPINNFIE
jgi:hypothetical protein